MCLFKCCESEDYMHLSSHINISLHIPKILIKTKDDNLKFCNQSKPIVVPIEEF